MIIFGIDPGTSITGYGVIKTEGNAVSFVDFGIINVKSSMMMYEKLEKIYDGLCDKMQKFMPQRVSIEQAFYDKNIRTTMVLGQARGIALLAAKKCGAVIAEYSAKEIKKSIVGNGNAKKNQVEYMVKMLLRLPKKNFPSDAYDALAAALCDFRTQAFFSKTRGIKCLNI
jgi:crossover junction endodeoxyribonuclease RuvC